MSIGPIGPGGPGNWDDLFSRFFGAAEPRRQQRIDITKYMSGDAREVLSNAASRAGDLADPERPIADLDTDHLLWAVLQLEPMRQTVRRAGADPDALLAALGRPAGVRDEAPAQVALTPAAKRALLDSLQISRALGSSYVGPEHILMALGLNPDSAAGRLLAGKLDPQALQHAEPQPGPGRGGPAGGSGKTPTLEQYGVDLTELARRGEIDPVIGRADEIEQTIEILSRRTKNNPVLIGEAGVGKTAIVEGLAQRIVDGDVPQTLEGKRVIQLDLAGLVAGTRYRGDFEERLRKVIDEIQNEGDGLIVFLDEIHTLVGAGGGGGEGGAWTPATCSSRRWPAASCRWSARPRSTSTASTSRRTRPWTGGSSRCWWASPASTTPWRSCAGCGTTTRRTTRYGSPTRRWTPRRSCPTATSPTASCRTRRST